MKALLRLAIGLGLVMLAACDGAPVSPTPKESLVLAYDFEDGQVPDWGGPAEMAVVDGALRITAGHNEWRYKVFDYVNPGLYQQGEFEFEVEFGAQAYLSYLKGHSLVNLSSYQAGPAVYFNQGVVWADEGQLKDTGARYLPGVNYRIRLTFNNALGDRGRFWLFMEVLDHPANEQYIGNFEYRAPDGRLADITELGFSGLNLDEVETTSFLIDNVRLVVNGSR